MSFTFDWQSFAYQEKFLGRCRGMLTDALNRKRPKIIESPIKVRELNWGSQAPSLEILDIGDVASDRFRGIFKITYSGEAYVTLATNVQANLLNVYQQTAPTFTLPTFVAAPASLSIPLILTLSDIELSGIVIIVYSKARGLTLVFRNDPLVSINVSSSFHSVPGIAQFLQSQIEHQIRGLFRDELPAILYRHSQKWTLNSQPELAASIVAAKRHLERRRMRLVEQHKQLQVQLHNCDQVGEEDDERPPVTFAEMNIEGKHISLGNLMHMEAIASSRRTLAITVPTISGVVYKSELFRRMSPFKAWGPVGLSGAGLYFNVHYQADRIASRSNHKMRKRVIRLNKNKNSTPGEEHHIVQQQRSALSAVESPHTSTSPGFSLVRINTPSQPGSRAVSPPLTTAALTIQAKSLLQSRHIPLPIANLRSSPLAATTSFDLKQAMFDKADQFHEQDDHHSAPPPAYVA